VVKLLKDTCVKLTRSAVELPVLASYSTGEVAAVITTGLLAATGGFTYRQ